MTIRAGNTLKYYDQEMESGISSTLLKYQFKVGLKESLYSNY